MSAACAACCCKSPFPILVCDLKLTAFQQFSPNPFEPRDDMADTTAHTSLLMGLFDSLALSSPFGAMQMCYSPRSSTSTAYPRALSDASSAPHSYRVGKARRKWKKGGRVVMGWRERLGRVLDRLTGSGEGEGGYDEVVGFRAGLEELQMRRRERDRRESERFSLGQALQSMVSVSY